VRKRVCLTVALLAVAMTPYSSQSQSVKVYDAHISKLQKSIPEWRAQIDEIDPAKIVVPYHIGKLIEDNKRVVLQNLDIVSAYVGMIPSQHLLSQEINLYAGLRDVRGSMDDLSDTLVYMVGTDQKAAQTWVERLGAIARGPLNEEEEFQIKALGTFADDLQLHAGNHRSPAKQ
jgi:hypothetical protein